MLPGRMTAAALLMAGFCMVSVSARAVDQIPAWNGFYAGAMLGYGFGKAPTNLTPDAAASTIIFLPYYVPSLEPSPQGVTGGVDVGYRHRFGAFVAGVVTDFSFAAMKDTKSGTAPFPFIGGRATTIVDSNLNWYGTLRGNLGVLPAENLLVYATGGLAYAGLSTTTTAYNSFYGCPGVFYCGSGTAGGVTSGAVIGGGIEYAFQPRWTLKAEYLSTRLDQSVRFAQLPPFPGTFAADTTFKFQVVRLGVAYQFGP